MADNYGAIRSVKELKVFAQKLEDTNLPFGFDIEAGHKLPKDVKGLALMHHHPEWLFAGFSLAGVFNPDAEKIPDRIPLARYVPVNHDDGNNIDDLTETARILWKLLKTGRAVAHNLMFEEHGTARFFRELLGDDPELGEAVTDAEGYFPYLSDSIIEASLIGVYPPSGMPTTVTGGPGGLGLKPLTLRVFGHQMTTFDAMWTDEELSMKVPKAFNNRDSNDPKVIEYACEDAKWCLALHLMHYPVVKDMPLYKYEMELIPVLCRMERTGLVLDWKLIEEKAAEVKTFEVKYNEHIQIELENRLGVPMNVNFSSPKQVSELLFDKLGLPVLVRNKKTDAPSTSAKALQPIAKKDPTVRSILNYREIKKLYGSYLDRYIKVLRYRDDDRGMPNHNQIGAVTGRFSVDGVSYQQWPKPYDYEIHTGEEFHFNFRDILLSPEDFRIVGYDFSQVELRMIAGITQEEALLDSFLNDEDVHTRTASEMLDIPLSEVTKRDRQIGKALADTEPVLTPNGWVPIGKMKTGMEVILPNGGTAKVGGVYPQGTRALYQVELSDGTKILADKQHRWRVEDSSGKEMIKTTQELLDTRTQDWYIDSVAPVEGVTYGKEKAVKPTRADINSLGGKSANERTGTISPGSSLDDRRKYVAAVLFSRDSKKVKGRMFAFKYSAQKKQFAQELATIVRSIGGVAKITPTHGTHSETRYEVSVDMPSAVDTPRRKIKSISFAHWGKATCIYVDHDDHEFITTGYTRTMNTLNFAIVYGAGAGLIASMLGMTKQQAQILLDKYFSAFPKFRDWYHGTHASARRGEVHPITGEVFHWVQTPFGRIIPLWEYLSPNSGVQSMGERLSTNAPPQGGAADYMKIGMVRAQKKIDELGWSDKALMVMTVHDALEFYLHKSISTQEFIDQIGPIVTFNETDEEFADILEGYPNIKADWHEGKSLGSMFEIELGADGKILFYAKEDSDIKHQTFEDALSGVVMSQTFSVGSVKALPESMTDKFTKLVYSSLRSDESGAEVQVGTSTLPGRYSLDSINKLKQNAHLVVEETT